MSNHILYKIPQMVYSGLLTGLILKLIIPNDNIVIKKLTIIAGVCIAFYTSYIQD